MGRIVPAGQAATVHSDLQTAYAQAFHRLHNRTIRHRTTSSREARTPRNRLFPANLADRLIRHTGANHQRETIAFSKRRQGALYRMAIFAVWRNYVKARSERRRDAPREQALPLRGWLWDCYFGRIPTRCLPELRTHRLQYAV